MSRKTKNLVTAIGFLLPFTIFYVVFTIYPIIQGFYVSLHKWGVMGKLKFLGLRNYEKLLRDKSFLEASLVTVKFVLLTVPLLLVIALALAMLVNREGKGRKFVQVSYYVPNVLSVTVISYCAFFMFKPYLGFVNNFLRSVGALPPGKEIYWLTEGQLPWIVVVGTTIWWTVGYSMMLYLAALKDIPEQLYEAAAIDGATKGDMFFGITFPLIRNTTWLIIMLQTIASFKVFGQFWLITGGGPGTKTRPLVQYIYETGFEKDNMGYASAMSFVFFLVLLLLTVIHMTIQKKSQAE